MTDFIIPKLDVENMIYSSIPSKLVSKKLVVIGKPCTGKTTLITSLINAKQHLFPMKIIISGTTGDSNHYSSTFPNAFVYNSYDDNIIKQFISHQMTNLTPGLLVLDDCVNDTTNTPLFQNLYKNGCRYNMLFILSLQYCTDVRPCVRINIDGVFILRETNLKTLKFLYENYAGVIPSFFIFYHLMDQLSTNNFTALYINNREYSNNWEDCVFWYREAV